MSDFLFCLIFIQVSIFFIAGILVCASFYFGGRKNVLLPARSGRVRFRTRRSPLACSMRRRENAGLEI